MIFGAVSIDATQWVGIAGFAVAGLLCARAARNSSPNWWILAVLIALLIVEIVAGWRYQVHDLADALLLNQGVYESRRPWQVAMIACALVALIAAGLAVRARIQSAALSRAAMGLCFGICIFVIETISLNAVDAVLYQALGPLKGIAFFWLAASTWISWAALIASRR
jgi:uncharacterized membrane protein